METLAVLHNNHDLLKSDANVKISRQIVRGILRRTPFICWSNYLLKRSYKNILKRKSFNNPGRFNLNELKHRLDNLVLDDIPQKPQAV